jgi:hypothetical protein
MAANIPNAAVAMADKDGKVARVWYDYLQELSKFRLPSYKVAKLPKGTEGQLAFATDGRKSGEAAGAGSGVVVWCDASGAWKIVDYTNNTVSA